MARAVRVHPSSPVALVPSRSTTSHAGASPADVVRLTIYVVGYDPQSLGAIRDAGGAFFAGRDSPAATILGVQTLARPGLLVAIEATAVTGTQ